MEIPRPLREQLRFFEKHGFKALQIESRKGSHFKVQFENISQPYFMSSHDGSERERKNMLCRLRRLSGERLKH